MQKKIQLVLSVLFMAATFTYSDGFRNPPEGAQAIGAFGAYRAFINDANAAIHNPANLVDLEGPMVQLSGTLGYGRSEFKSDAGTEKTGNPWFMLPGFSAAVPLADGRWALGFALNVPFGRSVEWDTSGSFGTTPLTSYSAEMMVLDANPTVAFKICDALSVAAGLNVYYSEVNQKTFWGSPFGTSKLTGEGDALGWNAAATWKITDRQRLAFTYRSPFTIDYKGDNETALTKSKGKASIDFPYIAALAYGIEFTDALRAEIDIERIGFGTYERLVIEDSLFPTTVVPQNWKDTWTFAIGGEWDFATNWTARTGFMYLPSPVPDVTYSPLGESEDQGVISFGLGYENEHYTIDLGYAYGLFDGRRISGNQVSAYNGSYDYNVHLLSLSYGYKF